MANYCLFSDNIYDDIKMDYRKDQLTTFFKLWGENKSSLEIATKMKLTEIEVYLLISDLHITGKLPERKTDFYGRERI